MWRPILTVLVFALGAAPAMAADGCPFLTDEELAKVEGRREILFKLEHQPLPDGAGTLCVSAGVYVVYFRGPDSEQHFDKMLKESGREGEERVPLPELGERAYALFLEARDGKNESPTTVAVVPSEQGTAVVSVKTGHGEPAQSGKPQAIELIKIVLANLL
jgi:hypothetical protein